jgi:hypothetical protein
MSKCEFVEEQSSNSAAVKGVTAFALGDKAPIKNTGVYLPPSHDFERDEVDVVLWFHGFYVHNAKDLMHPADSSMDMQLRQSVLKSGKQVIFVAPYLGPTGALDLGKLNAGDGCQTYLEQVLEGLARFGQSRSKGAPESLDLGTLILAGHSAGGAQMRAASRHLGGFKDNLEECWGFDCFYDTLYPDWTRELPNPDKVFYFANGSGGHGSHAFKMMKGVYGTPKNPLGSGGGLPNTYVAPAVDRIYTAQDDVAFESLEDVQDRSAAGPNRYVDVRKATDPLLDDTYQGRWWGKIYGSLTGHFQCVRDLLGPRIMQSAWLQDDD